jgi:nicotinamidase-related amidase
MLLEASKASLLIVDVQTRLLPAMAEPERIVSRCQVLLKAAEAMEIPVIVSEQYPKGLGHTVPELVGPKAEVFGKLSFSCWRDVEMRKAFIELHENERPLMIVAGIEAHVCVLQSCIDIYNAGFGVFAVADAMGSRDPKSAELAYDRLRGAGIQVISTEMAIFELMEKAGTPLFKTLSALIK